MKIKKFSVIVLAALLSLFIIPGVSAKAADEGIEIVEIDYSDSSITLKAGKANSTILISDGKQKTWEEVPGTPDADGLLVMDISWISTSKNTVISLKGNVDTKITTVTIPKAYTKFKASYKKATGAVVFSNTNSRTVEWRKKESTVWTKVNEATLAKELETLFTKGATIYFRLAPVAGTGTNAGERPSKEVSVTIPKKLTAPTITIDNTKLAVMLKSGMAYREVNEDGTSGAWINITKTEYVPLTTLAPDSMYTEGKTAAETTLQFRTNATASKQVSAVTTITVPAQKGMPDVDESGITLTYTGSTALSIQVKAASSTSPFEYAIIESDETFDNLKATWNTISSQNAVVLDDDTAEQGSRIYIRKKSTGTQGSDKYELASAEYNLTGSNGVAYPEEAKAEGITKLITTAGVCRTNNSDGYLTFILYSSTKTTVSDIQLHDAYTDTILGSVEFKSTVSENSDANASTDKKYIITTRIISTEGIDEETEKELFADISLVNGDKVNSTKESGVMLYLYEASKLDNPEDDDDYVSEFDRIYMSDDSDDEAGFKFRIAFGEQYLIDKTTNTATKDLVAVSKIKYDGYTLEEKDYTVSYTTETEQDGEIIAYAIINVNVAGFEKNAAIKVRDEYEPLVIYLTNGEILKDTASIKLVSTATLLNTPIAYAMTAGSLKETETTSVTDSEGKVTQKTEDVISVALELELFSKNYSVAINDVTWNGLSVYDSAQVSNGAAVVYLSNKKLNKLTSTSSSTYNLEITFSNGFVITSGCKLTVLKAAD